MKINIVSAFWNCSEYIERCIDSVLKQNYTDFKMYLIDDLSSDDTVEKIKSKIKDDNRFVIIKNKIKKYKLKNFDDLIMDDDIFHDEDVIIELDGDDYLYDENVVSKIVDKYTNNKDLWLTNGSFIYSNGSPGFSSKCDPFRIRKDVFRFSHLRTWKCHLWRMIEEESFLDDNGEYFKSAPDVAYSIPMLEMSGLKHYEFIPDLMYVYNAESPYNEHKQGSAGGGLSSQQDSANIIRRKKSYNPI